MGSSISIKYYGVEGYTFGWVISEIKNRYLIKIESDWLDTLYGVTR